MISSLGISEDLNETTHLSVLLCLLCRSVRSTGLPNFLFLFNLRKTSLRKRFVFGKVVYWLTSNVNEKFFSLTFKLLYLFNIRSVDKYNENATRTSFLKSYLLIAYLNNSQGGPFLFSISILNLFFSPRSKTWLIYCLGINPTVPIWDKIFAS